MKKWQRKLAQCCRSVDELKDRLGLPEEEAEKLRAIERKYPICVPEYYLSLIDRQDPHDPSGRAVWYYHGQDARRHRSKA